MMNPHLVAEYVIIYMPNQYIMSTERDEFTLFLYMQNIFIMVPYTLLNYQA